MARFRICLLILLMTLFVITPAIATDYEEGIPDSGSFDAYTLDGPFTISSLTQSGTSTKATFTDQSTFTTTDSEEKMMLGTAIATGSVLYLYVSGTTVYGVLVFNY